MRRVAIAAGALCAIGAALAADDRVVVNPRALYPEGPLSDGAGGFYYTEMGADRVMHWDGKANRQVWSRQGCGPTSVANFGRDLVVLCHIEASLVKISKSGVTLGVIDKDKTGRPFKTPNSSVNDKKGGIYFSSSGDFAPNAPAEGAVMYLDKAGTLSRLAEGIHYSNGVGLTPDGRTLYVSEHLERRLFAFDVAADGTLSNKRVFVRLDDLEPVDPKRGWEVGPDDMTLDSKGNIYEQEYGAGHMLIIGPDARLKATIEVPEKYITGSALTPDESHIFITAPVSLVDPTLPGKVYFVANPLFGKG